MSYTNRNICVEPWKRILAACDAVAARRAAMPHRPYLALIATGRRHALAKVLACLKPCGMGGQTGETTMAKVLDDVNPAALSPGFRPDPSALADRDRREALREYQSITAAFFGDPLPGMSALDRRQRSERAH